MSKLRRKSVRQLLEALELIRKLSRAGAPVRVACQEAIRAVAAIYGVAPQTIHDLCCRRLDLEHITEFHVAVQKWLTGHPEDIKKLVMRKANPESENEVRQFFGGVQPSASEAESSTSEEAMETFLVDLSHMEAKMLRILAEIESKSPSKLIHELLTESVKKKLKPLLEDVLKDSVAAT